MKLRPFRSLFVPLFVLALATLSAMRAQSAAPAAQAAPTAPALTECIPFDAAVTTGTLPNGLTYYIRRNTRPEKRVSLQLAVKAGSVDEENDQQGLAHFLEHMAFNGTKRFKPGELIARWNRPARGSARTSTPTRRSTRPSTCSSCRPTRRAWSKRACRRWRTSPAASASIRRRSTRSAAS